MLGAVFGDIVGSAYEWNNVKTKDFPFQTSFTRYTDDSVMTLAVSEGETGRRKRRACFS